MKVKKVKNVPEEYLAQSVVDFLRNEGIDAYFQAQGWGEVSRIYAGHSLSGYDIFVREEDYPEAAKAVAYFD